MRWKTYFMIGVFFSISCLGAEELTLVELVDLGLRQNPKTREAWAAMASKGYEWRSTRSALYPTLDVSGSYCLSQSRSSHQGWDNDQTAGYDLILTYLLLDFGGRSASIEGALQGFYASQWSRDRVLQEVILGVLEAYYRHVDAKASIEARELDLQDATTNLEAAKVLFEAGLTTKVDVLQSQSHLVNQQLLLEEQKGIYQVSLGSLANAVGLRANTPLAIADIPEDLPMERVAESVDALIVRAELERPDLASADAIYRQRLAELKEAQSNGKPTVTFGADLGRKNDFHSSKNSCQNYSGCLTLNVPLFHGYYFKNERRRAKANLDEACASLEDLETDASFEVLRSYYAFKTSVETFRYSEEFLKYSDETYKAALMGYKEGINTILDVLAAQSSLTRARSEHIQARTLWLVSLANLSFATGMLGKECG